MLYDTRDNKEHIIKNMWNNTFDGVSVLWYRYIKTRSFF